MEDVLKSKASYPNISKEDIESGLERKKNLFEERMSRYSWLSWNYADYRNEQFLKGKLPKE